MAKFDPDSGNKDENDFVDPAAESKTNEGGTGAPNAPDPFDPARLRLPQDFATMMNEQKVLTQVPVRKPAKEWWIRVHPDEEFRLDTAVIELKEEGELYIVQPELWPELEDEATFHFKRFYTAVNRQGVVFLWPVRLPDAHGNLDSWNRSAHEAAELSIKQGWIRVTSNRNLGAYDVTQPPPGGVWPVIWPKQSLRELLSIGLKDQNIDNFEHPVPKQLRGEV